MYILYVLFNVILKKHKNSLDNYQWRQVSMASTHYLYVPLIVHILLLDNFLYLLFDGMFWSSLYFDYSLFRLSSIF